MGRKMSVWGPHKGKEKVDRHMFAVDGRINRELENLRSTLNSTLRFRSRF
jgi:hypothetical protein